MGGPPTGGGPPGPGGGRCMPGGGSPGGGGIMPGGGIIPTCNNSNSVRECSTDVLVWTDLGVGACPWVGACLEATCQVWA